MLGGKKALEIVRSIYLAGIIQGFFYIKTPSISISDIQKDIKDFGFHPRYVRRVIANSLIKQGALEPDPSKEGYYRVNLKVFWQILQEDPIFNQDLQIIKSKYELIPR